MLTVFSSESRVCVDSVRVRCVGAAAVDLTANTMGRGGAGVIVDVTAEEEEEEEEVHGIAFDRIACME